MTNIQKRKTSSFGKPEGSVNWKGAALTCLRNPYLCVFALHLYSRSTSQLAQQSQVKSSRLATTAQPSPQGLVNNSGEHFIVLFKKSFTKKQKGIIFI